MRTSTGRALRISFTGVGVAAMGLALAGPASATELPGGTLGGNEHSDAAGDTGHASGPGLDTLDPVTGTAGLGGVDGTSGDLTGTGGADGLDGFQMPVAHHGRSVGGEHELPIISLPGVGGGTEGNDLFNGALHTGFDTPGITGLRIPLLD